MNYVKTKIMNLENLIKQLIEKKLINIDVKISLKF